MQKKSVLWLDHWNIIIVRPLKIIKQDNIVVETINRQEATNIEAFKEILESLRITEEYTLKLNRTIELALKDMSIVLALAVYNKITQVVIPKSMVPDSG